MPEHDTHDETLAHDGNPAADVLLDVCGLTVRFGDVLAVDDVSLHVCRGRMVGLIGANGAGKTTTLDALTGFVVADGSATFAGEALLGVAAHRRARQGLVRTWQSLELFDDLTVAENLLVAAPAAARGRGSRGQLWARTRAQLLARLRLSHPRGDNLEQLVPLLGRLGLPGILERFPTELSQGQRKLLGLARSLVMNPVMLLADEPAAGLDSAESRELGAQLRRLCADGLTILLVDHDMGLVLSTCDYIYVLDHGVLIAQGTPAEIRSNPQVIEAYLGRGGEPAAEQPGQQPRGHARPLAQGVAG